MLDNLSAHMGKGASVSVGAKRFFAHDIEVVFEERIDVTDAVAPAKAQYQKATSGIGSTSSPPSGSRVPRSARR